MFSTDEKKIMKKLLGLAKKQKGLTGANPLTAAAVVKNNSIIAIGVHKGVGKEHAEVLALKKAGALAKGAKLLVNLEPCTHWGHNPPCTDFIIKCGISEVIYSTKDPNPKVRKNSAKIVLSKANISVREGLLRDDAIKLNEVFFKNKIKSQPFITAKIGMSF